MAHGQAQGPIDHPVRRIRFRLDAQADGSCGHELSMPTTSESMGDWHPLVSVGRRCHLPPVAVNLGDQRQAHGRCSVEVKADAGRRDRVLAPVPQHQTTMALLVLMFQMRSLAGVGLLGVGVGGVVAVGVGVLVPVVVVPVGVGVVVVVVVGAVTV